MAEEDILFGKHRHLFGGIAPGNMKAFNISEHNYFTSGDMMFNIVLPDDTIIDGQTLCSVAGAVIRKKSDGFPKDEFDGTEVAIVHESGQYELDAGHPDRDSVHFRPTYFAAFPFSTQGVFNRNKANYLTVGDLGAITEAPGFKLKSYASYYELENNNVQWNHRASIYADVSGYKWHGYEIRVKRGEYPINETDGQLKASGDVGSSGATNGDHITIIDKTFITPTPPCFCRVFPFIYNGDGKKVYVRNIKNEFLIPAGGPGKYLYGYDLDTKDPNPATRVTYPDDVDNATFTPAKIIPDVTFDYGDWPSEPGVDFMPTPVMLASDGSIAGYLHPDDYDKIDIDGVTQNTSWNLADGRNAMMQWPKIYVKRSYDEETGIYKFRCSDYKIDSSWECWSNYDYNNNEIPYFYTSIYMSGTYDGILRSMSGQTITTGSSFRTSVSKAKINGLDWHIEEFADRLLIQDLLVMMAKTTDCQKAYGYGNVGNAITSSGTMNKKGLFWGSTNYSDYGVKVFGMEHWWGNYKRYMDGLVSKGTVGFAKITRGTKDGTTVSSYQVNSNTGYINIGTLDTVSGYVRKMDTHAWGRIPIDHSGSATTYEADCCSVSGSTESSTTYHATVGHYPSAVNGSGPFMYAISIGYDTTSDVSTAALSYKPSAS